MSLAILTIALFLVVTRPRLKSGALFAYASMYSPALRPHTNKYKHINQLLRTMFIARYILNKPPEPTLYATEAGLNAQGDDYVALGKKDDAMHFFTEKAMFRRLGTKSAHAFKAERVTIQ